MRDSFMNTYIFTRQSVAKLNVNYFLEFVSEGGLSLREIRSTVSL